MSTLTTPPDWSLFERREFSPDGTWQVVYAHWGGERSPMVTAPRVIEVRTQRIVVDFWRDRIDATVSDFTPRGFRVRVIDTYYPTEIHVSVDVPAATFALLGRAPARPHLLANLAATMSEIIDRAHEEMKRQATPPPPLSLDISFWGCVKRWA